MLEAVAKGVVDKMKEAIKKNANINEQNPDVSFTLL